MVAINELNIAHSNAKQFYEKQTLSFPLFDSYLCELIWRKLLSDGAIKSIYCHTVQFCMILYSVALCSNNFCSTNVFSSLEIFAYFLYSEKCVSFGCSL